MSTFWNFLFGAILIIIWIIAGVYVTEANIFLTSYKDTDDLLHRAYWFTFWAAFVTWGLIALFILLIILSIFGVVALFGSGAGEVVVLRQLSATGQLSSENQQLLSQGLSWFTIGFLILALILISTTGILAAISAASIVQSSNFDDTIFQLTKAYHDCIIAASISLGAVGVLIVGIIVYIIIYFRRQSQIKAEEEQIAIQRAKISERLDEIEAEIIRRRLQEKKTQ